MPEPDKKNISDLRPSQDYAFAVIGPIVWKNCSPAKLLLDDLVAKSEKAGIEVPKKVLDTMERIVEYKEFPSLGEQKEYYFYKTGIKAELLYIAAVNKDQVKWYVIPE